MSAPESTELFLRQCYHLIDIILCDIVSLTLNSLVVHCLLEESYGVTSLPWIITTAHMFGMVRACIPALGIYQDIRMLPGHVSEDRAGSSS